MKHCKDNMSDTIVDYWSSQYPECDPIPYMLRNTYRSRWVRFHSLPQSKRYAENEAEYRTILDRHNRILQSLAQPNETLIFSSTGYSETRTAVRDPQLDELDPSAEHWHTIAKHEIDDDAEPPNFWHSFAACYRWTPQVFDSLLRLVADDIVANTMILSTVGHWIYHPYDGGADVILSTRAQRDHLKTQFSHWLSSRSDGM